MSGFLTNVTTPFKASAIALVSHQLVAALGMSDADAGMVGDAAWLLLSAVLAYVVPADFGSGISGRMLAWVLKIKG